MCLGCIYIMGILLTLSEHDGSFFLGIGEFISCHVVVVSDGQKAVDRALAT